jgi:hypothetical protein
MIARSFTVVTVFSLVFCIATAPVAVEKDVTTGPPSVEHALGEPPAHQNASAGLDTFTVASYSFDGVVGGADPQGWVPVDLTDQSVYFHVDDFAGMPSPWGALSGSQSMWLGVRDSNDPPICGWANPPGYGNSWRQELVSTEFAVTGDVYINYDVRWDSEATYDLTYLEYRAAPGPWTILQVQGGISQVYTGTGQMSESIAISAANHSGTIQFRFLFISDGGISDEDFLLGGFDFDGAIVIDDLVVTDQNGVIDSQDFEVETVGDTQTLDGDWIAGVAGVFGNFGALFSGLTVVQEDPVVTNVTNLWGFFNGSPNSYACGGFPGQPTVPVEVPTDLPFISNIFVQNETRSPVIDITQDENGKLMPPDAPIIVSFDVYRDLPLNTGVRYKLVYRSIVDGCPGPWKLTLERSGVEKQWFRESFDITAGVDPAATAIQIALRCLDQQYINDPCHTHSPLFDNVHVGRVADALTGVGEVPAAQMALHQNVPNPFNPTTKIRYEIGRPTRVRLMIFSPSGAHVRTLVDGMESPRSGGHSVTWDGRDQGGKLAASGVYFYRLEAAGIVESRKMVMLN